MKPSSSPWGSVQEAEQISPGIYFVSTAGHGGLMVHRSAYAFSPKALELGAESFGEYFCFEEDCAWAIAAFELRRAGFSVASHVSDVNIRQTIERWFPEYFNV